MKIAVAMSGGVDSSVCVWLLKSQGHQVTGFTLKLGYGPEEAIKAARAAAKVLSVPHQIVDAGDSFRSFVLKEVATARNMGLTPNPCVLCNRKVKFPLLLRAAEATGCGMLATGHYARLEQGPAGPVLKEGADAAKSQAYFLARVGRESLRRVIFPLGERTKQEVRDLARREGLAVAEKADSQDTCFLPPGGLDQLMAEFGGGRPGAVVDSRGRELGCHRGLHNFTIGQRRGLGISLGRAMYVVGLEADEARVRVGGREELFADGLFASGAMWFTRPGPGEELEVRLRSTQRPTPCRVWPEEGGGVRVSFPSPEKAITPGQLAVFSLGGLITGSAWIIKATTQEKVKP